MAFWIVTHLDLKKAVSAAEHSLMASPFSISVVNVLKKKVALTSFHLSSQKVVLAVWRFVAKVFSSVLGAVKDSAVAIEALSAVEVYCSV